MKNKINKWGRLEQNQQVQNYGLGSWLKENAGTIGTIAGTIGGSFIGMPQLGAAVGGAVGGAVQNSGAEEEQKKLQQQQLMAQRQQQLAGTQSTGGLPGMLAMGGYLTPELLAKSGIYIKPENRGKFTATKERTGKTTEELTHSKNPLTRKRAIFAQNAKKWNHATGGYMALGGPTVPPEGEPTGVGLGVPSTSKFEPSDKTQWIPQSAALSRYKDLISKGKKEEAENMIFGYYANEPYGPYDEKTHGEYESKGRIKSMKAKDLIDLDTKKYKAPKDYEALIDVIKPKLFDRNPGYPYQNLSIKMAKGGFVNPLATEQTGIVNYSAGGTHNMNPLGGIPLGKSQNGKSNSVEQGETSFKFKEGKYIFSNRLKLGK